jgi:hypothetical protein
MQLPIQAKQKSRGFTVWICPRWAFAQIAQFRFHNLVPRFLIWSASSHTFAQSVVNPADRSQFGI